jgi:sugar/nucleoside kinase (ribokinase family)
MAYKHNYKNEALEFLTDPGQVDCKLGDILEGLVDEGGEHFVLAIKELSVTEIVNAALLNTARWSQARDKIVEATLNKDVVKWSKKIEEIKENRTITRICPNAKILTNSYEEISLSLSEITDSQIHELTKMFGEYSIKIIVESSSLLVRIIRDTESL